MLKAAPRKELVTKERVAKLKTFAAALADLCDKFQVDIQASRESESTIDVIERTFKYPEGYAYSAMFEGVDKLGVWNTCNPKGKPTRGFSIDRWMQPEDE